MDAQCAEDVLNPVRFVVSTVVGFGGLGHAPAEDGAADDFGDAFAVGGRHHHKAGAAAVNVDHTQDGVAAVGEHQIGRGGVELPQDRKSTRLNSSHVKSSYAVFCLKNKRITV